MAAPSKTTRRLNALHTRYPHSGGNRAPNRARFGRNYDGAGTVKEALRSSGGGLALGLDRRLASAPRAATTERVVIDRHTGLAIYGIDPVAYFTDRKPRAGREDFELRHAGAIWRFENEGNRAAFAADPDVYMPRFGGYDPVGVSRGVATPGQAGIVGRQRSAPLSLLYGRSARGLPRRSRRVIAAAAARWSAVKSELAGLAFSRRIAPRRRGSPQAMKPATRNASRAAVAECAPSGAVTMRLRPRPPPHGPPPHPIRRSARAADRCRPRPRRAGRISAPSRQASGLIGATRSRNAALAAS